MTALPAWASNNTARALLVAIAENPQSIGVKAHAWTEQRVPRFTGPYAHQLRQMYENALNAASGTMDEAYREGGDYDVALADFEALVRAEKPDELIARIVETGALAPVVRLGPWSVAA